MDFSAITEALRRRQGLGNSAAGIPGGAPAANVSSPSNPISQMGVAPSPIPQGQQGMQPGFDPQPQTSALAEAKPGTASIIVKSLIKYLDRLQPEG